MRCDTKFFYVRDVAFPSPPKEHVEIHALQEELAQRDAELKALRTDLAAAYAKLKDDDDDDDDDDDVVRA